MSVCVWGGGGGGGGGLRPCLTRTPVSERVARGCVAAPATVPAAGPDVGASTEGVPTYVRQAAPTQEKPVVYIPTSSKQG